jgi:hypothetical protein
LPRGRRRSRVDFDLTYCEGLELNCNYKGYLEGTFWIGKLVILLSPAVACGLFKRLGRVRSYTRVSVANGVGRYLLVLYKVYECLANQSGLEAVLVSRGGPFNLVDVRTINILPRCCWSMEEAPSNLVIMRIRGRNNDLTSKRANDSNRRVTE